MTAREAWKQAWRNYRRAVREWKKEVDLWLSRDVRRFSEEPPAGPAMPVGLIDIDYLVRRPPWDERIGKARPRLLRLAREARNEAPPDPVVARVIAALGREPATRTGVYQRELAAHLGEIRCGKFNTGMREAELKATRAMFDERRQAHHP